MKKKTYIAIVVLIIVLAGLKILLTKGEKKINLKKNKSGKASVERGTISVQLEPSGSLLSFPESFTLYFSDPVCRTPGIVIDEKEIVSYVETKPYIKFKGKWEDSTTFVLTPLTRIKPGTRYTFFIKKIPLKSVFEKGFTKAQIEVITPFFKPVSVIPVKSSKGKTTVKVRFNLPVKLSSVIPRLTVLKDGEKVDIKKIDYLKTKSGERKDVVIVTFNIARKGIYTLKLAKGFESVYGDVSSKDYNLDFSIGFINPPIIVKGVKVRDLGDIFSVDFNLVTLQNTPVTVKTDNLDTIVSISPSVGFEVYSSKGHLSISGDFVAGKQYTVLLFSGLKGTRGEILKNDYKAYIEIPHHKPKLMFLYRGRYFGTKGEWKFPFVAKRLKEVKLTLFFIPEKNIALWYQQSNGENWAVPDYSKVMFEDKIVKVENISGGLNFLDLKDLIKNPEKGIYVLKAKAYSKETKRFYEDTAKFVVSNLSIIAKFKTGLCHIFVLNSNDATPVKGARVKVLDRANIVIGKGETNSNGYVKIKTEGEREPAIIVATTGSDWTYLRLSDSTLPSSNFDITGEDPGKRYLAYLYFERDLYRPGEEVHCAVVLRKNKTFQPVSIPVDVKVFDPRGRFAKKMTALTDKNGFAEFVFKTSPSSPTGQYTFSVEVGKKTICSENVFIETFAPERMGIDLKFPDIINLNKPFTLKAKAYYLFGAPASGETLKGNIELKEFEFKPEGYQNYSFGPLNYYFPPAGVSKDIEPQTLDKEGRTDIKVFFSQLPEFFNPVRLTAYLEVSEGGGGRATSKSFSKTIYPKRYYIGLNCGASKVTSGVPLKIKGVLLDKDAHLKKGESRLSYRVFRVAYNYDYYFYNTFNWRANSTLIPLTGEKSLTTENGRFEIVYTPSSSYDDIVVEVWGEGNRTQLFINGWGWWETERAETPETLIIHTDKKEYDWGEKVKATVSLPFKGKILWCVEADDLVEHHLEKADGRVSSFEFTMPDGYQCVYISALLIHTGKNYLITRAFGIKRAKASPSRLKLNLKLNAKTEIKPGSTLEIRLKSDKKFEGTISVVDEGILQITNFPSPDPFNGVLKPIWLDLQTSDGFGWFMKKYLATGGGMSEPNRGFAQPHFAKVVSIWSGKLESDESGRLVFRTKIPQYNGKLRVMVTGVSGEKLGSAEQFITVKSNVVVMPTIPRFLSTGDTFEIPVSLINTTKKSLKAIFKASITGGSPSQFKKEIELSSKGKKLIYIPLKASKKPGKFEISLECIASGEMSYKDRFSIPIYPSSPRTREVTTLKIDVKRKNLRDLFSNWESRGHHATIMVSTVPGLSKLHFAKDIIDYPYGCLEQVSTKTLVMLKLQKLLPAIAPKISVEKYNSMVQSGINRIISMQTISGGFAYWPGSSEPEGWLSGYATFVLLEAKKSGFQVPDNSINAALDFLMSRDYLDPFGYYVLSVGGRLQKKPALVQQIEVNVKNEKVEPISLLWYSGALYNCGKAQLARLLFQRAISLKPDVKERYEGDFYSPVKFLSVVTYISEVINFDRQYTLKTLNALSGTLSMFPHDYYNTQEIAWSMLAIGKYAEKYLKGVDFNATLKINGKDIKGRSIKGVWVFDAYNLPGKDIVIASSKIPYFVDIVNDGYKTNGKVKHSAYGMHVKEALLDYRTGEAIDSLKQGELAILKVSVWHDGSNMPNCAIEVPLAGGLEVENPRLKNANLPQWVLDDEGYDYQDELSYDYIDIKDNMVIIFTWLYSSTKENYYLIVRGVTPGRFYLAPAVAKAMYRPVVNAIAFGRNIEVKRSDEGF